jgi:sirohydrochlorin ferrochelatase
VRDPRLTGSRPPLVLAAHGSTDPRFADVVDAIAAQLRARRPGVEVRIGYLDHGPPSIANVVGNRCVVVPLLLSGGYHLRVDIPAQARDAVIAAAVGPDPLLAAALADRLHEAGYVGQSGVVLAAAGSSDERALDDVRAMAGHLGARLGVDVTAAFVSAGSPRVADIGARVVASYLLAPGTFHDAVAAIGGDVVSAPIGAHPAIAEVVLARYDATQVPGRTAPA